MKNDEIWARRALVLGVVTLAIAWTVARAEPQVGGTAGAPAAIPDLSKVEMVLPAAPGWQARLIHADDVGVWTVGEVKAFPFNGCPEVFALDDKGRCRILSCYSQRWTTWNTVEDVEWLGALAQVDLDPKRSGVEMYTGGKRGNLYRIVAHDGGFDSSLIAQFRAEELHTAVAGDLLRSRPGNELLIFTHLGNAYDIRLDATKESGYSGHVHGVLPGRVRQAILLPAEGDNDPEIAGVLRSGQVVVFRMTADGFAVREVLAEPMGFGRIAMRPAAPGKPTVLYVCRDDGVVLRLERKADGSFGREIIFAGPQGPRGIAAGRFDADPDVETVAVFGYSAKVQLLSRRGGGTDATTPWKCETIFEDVDRGHWLSPIELDGRNGTTEIIGSGYAGRVFQLAREPGYGLTGIPIDPGPLAVPPPPKVGGDAAGKSANAQQGSSKATAAAAPTPRSTTDSAHSELEELRADPPRLAVISRAASIGELSTLGYRGGFETKTLLHDTLVHQDEPGRFSPGLAESWRIEDAGRVFVFSLRENARFADGSPADAAAVSQHLRRFVNLPEHSWLVASDRILEVRAVSSREIRIVLDRPTALLADLCAINPCSIQAPASISRDGERVAAIGAGSYRLESFGKESFRLARTPYAPADYAPLLDLVRFEGPTQDRIADEFLDGSLDGFADGAYELVPRARLAELRAAPGVSVAESPGSSLVYLSFRSEGPCADRSVRRRISRAIDRATLIANALHGAAKPVASFADPDATIAPGLVASEARGTGSATPLARPIVLLVKAGSPDEPIAVEIARQLRIAGIAITIDSLPTADHDVALDAGAFDLRIERTWGAPYDPYITLTNRFLPRTRQAAATLLPRDADSDITRLVLELTQAAEPEAFATVLKNVHAAIDARAALVPLCIPARFAVYRPERLILGIGRDLYRIAPRAPAIP